MSRTIGIIQARMCSTRLPGKVLRSVGDRCLLRRVLDRVRQAGSLDAVVVATGTAGEDDPIADRCGAWDCPCFRGSPEDVLNRFVQAARSHGAEYVVRVNSDNPLIDPRFIDRAVAELRAAGGDYVSYRRGDGRPAMLTASGFFSEAMTAVCLGRAAERIIDLREREHVTLGIYQRPDVFDVRWLDMPSWADDPRWRLTVDTQADLALLEQVTEALGEEADTAPAEEVVRRVRAHPIWLAEMERLNQSNPKTASR